MSSTLGNRRLSGKRVYLCPTKVTVQEVVMAGGGDVLLPTPSARVSDSLRRLVGCSIGSMLKGSDVGKVEDRVLILM